MLNFLINERSICFFECLFTLLGSLSMQRFWTTDGNRKCAVFVFYFSSHYHINVVESLFTSRYDQFENLRETTVLACEMSTSGWRPWLKNVACLSSLMTATDRRNCPYGRTKCTYRRIFVYTFCLINICLSLSDDSNKIKTLNIERA